MLLLVAGVVADAPMLVLSALVVATTLLMRRVLALDLAVPAAVLALLGTGLLAGVAADAAGVDLLHRPILLIGVYAAWILVPVLLPRSGAGDVPPSTPYGRSAWPAYLPSAAVLLVAARSAVDERLTASWAVLGTDTGVHMVALQQVQEAGSLDYGGSGYPRAFHMLAALVSVPGRALGDPTAALGYDLRLVAASACAALALLTWTCACTVLRLAAARDVSRVVAVVAATVGASALLLMSAYVRAFVYQSATGSLLAAAVLWVLPLSALALRGARHRLLVLTLVAMTAAMLLAHLWQALALCPVLALLAYAAPRLRRPGRLLRELCPTPGLTGLLVCCAVGTAFVAVLPMLAVVADGGLGLAAIPGMSPGPPLSLQLGAAAAAVVLLRRCRSDVDRLQLGVLAGLVVALTAMLRSNGQGLDLTQYYPQKVLWFLTVFTLPVASLVGVAVLFRVVRHGWHLLGRSGRFVGVVRPVGIAAVVAVLVAFVAPVLSIKQPAALNLVRPHPSAPDVVRRLDIAREHAVGHGTAVAVPVSLGNRPLPDRDATGIISRLMSFQTGQPVNAGSPDRVCDEIRFVAADAPAVVVTALESGHLRRLMRNRGCGDVPVVQVPGGGAHPAFLPKK